MVKVTEEVRKNIEVRLKRVSRVPDTAGEEADGGREGETGTAG